MSLSQNRWTLLGDTH